MNFPEKLEQKLTQRKETQALRELGVQSNWVDFSSNDYLGFAKMEIIFDKTHQFLLENKLKFNGATGSRLLTGNNQLYTNIEKQLATLHRTEAALIFNSGYDANIGFFATVPQRGDVILYDELIHASIRDGIQLTHAKSFKFKHNNIHDLEEKIIHFTKDKNQEIYVVTESVFSMDGDSPDLVTMAKICKKNNAYFVVDEAHALGVFNLGLIQKLQLENAVFARIITFGKALGCHGAAILTSKKLQQYLINFARSFIYTTGLSPHALATIKIAYNELLTHKNKEKLQQNIQHFIAESAQLPLPFIKSNSAIHCCIISGNQQVKQIASKLQQKGFDVRAILSPTVPKNQERLRFCLHAYNSKQEITNVLALLTTFVTS
ncbi:aminotransferase class I/II-fold pyridoxal phosphate-dependent enzyme [Tenacibaculum sp. UWU-22]|uniref:aminotransferase class I/II-fold pyridoxal phosphate-dependent enzyme n=1 Tax=Tenacibaculum sp. UWU-22 TaxID=3234187 RepID=UPI0034DABED3